MKRRLFAVAGLLAAVTVLAACGGGEKAASPTATAATPTSTLATPAPTASVGAATPGPRGTPAAPPAPEVKLPAGFAAFVVAENLSEPTSIAVEGKGRVYVSELGGVVWRLRDDNGDGVFEARDRFVEVAPSIDGIALGPDGSLYVSHTGRVTVASAAGADGAAASVREIVSGLPNGRHQNNGLAFGADGKLYLTNGSTCNDCQESDPRSATILRLNPDGTNLEVFAHGLRNPYDLAFTPDGRLWATDNGADPPCATIDELNLIEEGKDYGWPYSPGCDALAKGVKPVANLGYFTSSDGLAYYDAGAFPAEYRGSFFVAQYGANSGDPNIGKRVMNVKVRDTAQGPQDAVADFALGLDHPLDVAVDQDGSLLVADFGSGKVYRITYGGS